MAFLDVERKYLESQSLGRLATVTAAGAPNLVAVGFRLNDDGTIDIGGPDPQAQRYRNVRANPTVSFLVDDMTPNDPAEVKPGWGRGVEVRGRAEIVMVQEIPVAPDWFTHEVIRIHPQRIRSWHIDRDNPNGRSASM